MYIPQLYLKTDQYTILFNVFNGFDNGAVKGHVGLVRRAAQRGKGSDGRDRLKVQRMKELDAS